MGLIFSPDSLERSSLSIYQKSRLLETCEVGIQGSLVTSESVSIIDQMRFGSFHQFDLLTQITNLFPTAISQASTGSYIKLLRGQ